MALHFASSYDLAVFVVRILVLPVILGCAIAGLRTFKSVSRGFWLAYEFAVAATIISLVFYIAEEARYASGPRNVLISSRPYLDFVRPLLILDVFVVALDLIARIATFIVVTQLAVNLASGRRKFLQLLRIVVVLILGLIFLLVIAFHGHYADITTRLANSRESLDPLGWASRSADIDTAFLTVYLVGVLAAFVLSISLPSWPLRMALISLLLISILALASASGLVSFYMKYLSRDFRYDYNVFGIYNRIEVILEVFLQTGILVVLLFASAPGEHVQKRVVTEV